MDLVSAEAQLNTLIEKRAGARSSADEAADMWRRSEARHRQQLREANRSAWVDYFSRMAAAHTKLGEDFWRRAEALREGRG